MLELLTYFPWWCYPLMIIGVFIVLFTFIAITDIDVIGPVVSIIGNIIVFPIMLLVLFILVCRRLLHKHETEFDLIPFTDFYMMIFKKIFNMKIEQELDAYEVQNVFGAKEPRVSETTYIEWE